MQDRFKFRVWDKENKEFDYPFYLDNDSDLHIDSWDDGLVQVSEKRYVIQQSTGLKDKNGKLIYEGDILKHYTGKSFKLVFETSSCGFLLYQPQESEYYYPCYNTDQFKNRNICNMEVIGNIYENPELLTEEAQA